MVVIKSPDFYTTAAQVIPVLALATVLQGKFMPGKLTKRERRKLGPALERLFCLYSLFLGETAALKGTVTGGSLLITTATVAALDLGAMLLIGTALNRELEMFKPQHLGHKRWVLLVGQLGLLTLTQVPLIAILL